MNLATLALGRAPRMERPDLSEFATTRKRHATNEHMSFAGNDRGLVNLQKHTGKCYIYIYMYDWLRFAVPFIVFMKATWPPLGLRFLK